MCGGTHKVAHCPTKVETASPEVATVGDETASHKVVTTRASKDADTGRMTLLERIALLNHIKYLPTHCAKCGRQNLEHLDMECLMYKQCIGCYQWGPRYFVRHHSCSAVSEVSWGANADYYKEEWYQGRDCTKSG